MEEGGGGVRMGGGGVMEKICNGGEVGEGKDGVEEGKQCPSDTT